MSRMSGPRIRTLKPECWRDERFSGLSDLAHRLYVGLITQADDEGRQSANPALIRSQIFPLDERPVAELVAALEAALVALDAAGLIGRYEADGRSYLHVTSWDEDQRVDKPTPSKIPPPPERSPIARDTSVIPREDSPNVPASRAPADRSGPDQDRTGTTTGSARDPAASGTPTTVADPDVLPDDLPDALAAVARDVLVKLTAVWKERGGNTPTLRGVGLAVRRFPDRDHAAVLAELEHWATAGRGARQAVKDWSRTYGTFLERSPAGSPTAAGSPRMARPTSARVDLSYLDAGLVEADSTASTDAIRSAAA